MGCPTLESLLEEWEKVLAAFEKNGLTLNGKKTIVGLRQIELYGFLLTENGACPSPKKGPGPEVSAQTDYGRWRNLVPVHRRV